MNQSTFTAIDKFSAGIKAIERRIVFINSVKQSRSVKPNVVVTQTDFITGRKTIFTSTQCGVYYKLCFKELGVDKHSLKIACHAARMRIHDFIDRLNPDELPVKNKIGL
jgi:hypothetical protein